MSEEKPQNAFQSWVAPKKEAYDLLNDNFHTQYQSAKEHSEDLIGRMEKIDNAVTAGRKCVRWAGTVNTFAKNYVDLLMDSLLDNAPAKAFLGTVEEEATKFSEGIASSRSDTLLKVQELMGLREDVTIAYKKKHGLIGGND